MFFSPTAPDDYISIRTVITFSPGETSVLVPVNTIDDEIVESEEDFSALLTGPSSGLMLGDTPDALIIIADNNDGKYQLKSSSDLLVVLFSDKNRLCSCCIHGC